ncbi:uncharacterized protein TNCV_4721911 [Trichonephila clavipes]|uniref:Zinc finger RING-type eukaryotic domain-containing protein n=1 Tax=Trichonephila clavipes TaxID=2585209 RepID=A0A8X6W686_TRICX|nr:uncharacterized protein TNCV_4721911 [Trichonephila clavipes]
MEHELAFTLHLAMYQEADLGDYITFMMNFRGVLIRLKPSEVIELETVFAVNIIDLMMEILPYHDPHDVPWFESFSYFEPADLDSEFMEQEAAKGKGAFVQALWTQYAIPKLYFLVYKAWRRYGAQNLTTWTRLAQAVLDGCFGQKWPDCVFQVPDACSICLSTMHWPETTQCGHAFHLRCLLRHLDVNTRDVKQKGTMGKEGKGWTKIMKRIEWDQGKQTKACNEPSIKQIIFFFNALRIKEAKIQEETEEEETEEEEVVCGCRHFRPVPRGMRGRRKDRVSEYVGFYDSLLENPEMWEEGVTYQNGLGNDVWGMVQRYLRQDLMWFHIMVKHDVCLIHFVRRWKRFGINVSYCPFGVCAMDW